MKLNIKGQSIAGTKHLSTGQINQDYIKYYEDDRIFAVCISDGASGAEEAARPAAEATAAAGIEFSKNGKIWDMPKNSQISEELLRICDNHYLELSSTSKFPYERLCATTALVIINKYSSEFLSISIGDCSVMLIDKGFNASILLSPVNYFSKRNTLFANSASAGRFMKIEKGRIDSGNIGFVLITDGAEELLEVNRSDDIRRISALTVLDSSEAEAALKECTAELSRNNPDDITAAFVMLDDETTRRLAAAELGKEYSGCADDEDVSIYRPEEPEEDETAGTIYHIEPDNPETSEDIVIADPDEATLIGFISETPRCAEEIILAGFVNKPTELLTILFPYLRDGLITYSEHRFMKGR